MKHNAPNVDPKTAVNARTLEADKHPVIHRRPGGIRRATIVALLWGTNEAKIGASLSTLFAGLRLRCSRASLASGTPKVLIAAQARASGFAATGKSAADDF